MVGVEHTDLTLEGKESPFFCGHTLANLAESLQFCVFLTGSILWNTDISKGMPQTQAISPLICSVDLCRSAISYLTFPRPS